LKLSMRMEAMTEFEDETPLVYPLGHEQPPRLARRMAWRNLIGEAPASSTPASKEPESKDWWSWYDTDDAESWNIPAPKAPGMRRRSTKDR